MIRTYAAASLLAGLLLAACPGEPPDPGTCIPTAEICDGVDNDCDDEVDEGCGATCTTGTTECADGSLRTCVDTGGGPGWSEPRACASGFCEDAASCGGCTNGCPAAGQTQCTAGALRTCTADANGCLDWGTQTPCADGFCESATACGQCEHGCPAVGAAACEEGAIRRCVADPDGCRAWGAPTACSSGFCENAASCGDCNNTCPGGGATECADGRLRTCEADATGCLAWSGYTDCPDGFCTDDATCGTCADLCAPGETLCSAGRLRTCEADPNGCMGWSDYTACPDGFCTDDATCGTCSDTCPATGTSECADGRVRTCEADANGCLAWAGYADCAEGFCADATSCGACNDACAEGEIECTGGTRRTCVRDQNGCLAWDAGTACPANHVCEGEVCVASTSQNDTCANAQPLTFYGDTAVALGDTNLASDSAQGSCVGGDTKDLVYSFTLSSPRSVTAAVLYSSSEMTVYIRKSCDSDAPLDELACAKEWDWASPPAKRAFVGYLPAGTYYVWVDGDDGVEAGAIRLEVTLGAPIPPPANDTCSGAEPLQFTNDRAFLYGSTEDAHNDSYGQCGGDLAPDVVYTFTLTSPRAVDISLVSRSYEYGPKLRLAAACDTPGEEISCRGSLGGADWGAGAYLDYTYLEPGTYYLWADGSGAGRGEFSLEVILGTAIPPPANDNCAGAEPLSFFNGTATASGTTYGALPDTYGTCYAGTAGYMGDDVVYSFTTAVTSSVDVTLTRTASESNLSHYGVVYLRSDCDDRSSELECEDGREYGPPSFYLPRVAPGTYYIWADLSQTFHIGFDLEVTLGDAVGPPANDTCQGAHPLNVASYSYEESGATVYATTYEAARDHTTCSADGTHPEVVFSFYAQNSGSHSIKLVSSTDMALWVSEGTCGGSCMQYEDSNGGSGTEYLHLQTVAGQTYYVYVGGAQPGEFTVLVTRNLP